MLDALSNNLITAFSMKRLRMPPALAVGSFIWAQWLIALGIMVFQAVITKGRIIMFIPWIFSGGKIGGGGRSGGGGAGGKW